MGTGYLKVEATAAFDAFPVEAAQITVKDEYGQVLYQLLTDASGVTDIVELSAPDLVHTLSPDHPGPYYAVYTVTVSAPGYEEITIHGVQVFDTETSILPVEMHPQTRSGSGRDIFIPSNALETTPALLQQGAALRSGFFQEVVIPQTITVHLGTPSSNARNVRVGFADYIKNVASSEIYPTWPDAALEANIYCQISFALNRVYTEWYPSRGYAFHITNSTSYDQYYVDGRNIYENISRMVDEIFNVFIRRAGYNEPFFSQFCNGTTVTCSGLSQWGTVTLANQGLNAYSILRRYYPADIQLVMSNNIAGIEASYPGAALRTGSQGTSVQRMQVYLNRIRVNYPLIPQISNPNGIFGSDTEQAVRTFQRVFDLAADGIIGKSTWYKIISIYNAVKKLADMNSEGDRIGIGTTPPTSILREGSRGADVVQLQFILNYIAEFFNDIPDVLENSLFDSRTTRSVRAFQQKYGLTADGIVGSATWNKLYAVYHSLEESVTEPPSTGQPGNISPPYPGVLLRNGSRGDSVRLMQQYLNAIYRSCPGYAPLSEDGIFGAMTQAAVTTFQGSQGLSPDGIIGPMTWNAIVAAYSKL